MITDYVKSTNEYMKNNLQAETIGVIIIMLLIILIIISIIFIVFRKNRLKYWRINEQIETLESIDKSLKTIKQKLPESFKTETILKSTEKENKKEKLEKNKTLEECVNEIKPVDIQIEETKIAFDKKDKEERAIVKSRYNVGKTGEIYAEEILRKQIQF